MIIKDERMPLEITYSKNSNRLTVTHTVAGKTAESIVMEAHSGGWDAHRALPKGKWLIVENPSGDRTYFGLFYQDKNVNDQFKHGREWRDGIRFGFHSVIGSHGCIMTKPAAGQSLVVADNNWKKIQKLIRTKRVRKLINYQNNENSRINDLTKYTVSSYGDMTVTD